MKVARTALEDVLVVEPDVHSDDRGHFFEAWHRLRYAETGLPTDFVQDNFSFSRRGVLRGMHFQHPAAQGKLVFALEGEVYDVAVDIRVGSPTFGRWVGLTLSGQNRRQVWIPAGFAHGFCVTSDTALVGYKCTNFYAPGSEGCLIWNDADVAIRWPVSGPIVSAKDRAGRSLQELKRAQTLPRYAISPV
jgi:dTDP-4-dehydrorhamnose 3,5-epimerase